MAKLIKWQGSEVLGEFSINKAEFRIGRAADNDIVINDETVSSYHAIIVIETSDDGIDQKGYRVKDLGSTNKTYVNNKSVSAQVLMDKDVIRIGLSHFEFCNTSQAYSLSTEFQRTTKLHKSWIPGVFYTKK